jgi:hypothetical protein
LSKIIDAYSAAHQLDRFPVDVKHLALNAHEIFGWTDPIAKVKAASIKGFEGCLLPNDDKSQWLLLYNNTLRSSGRIRFTQAHELGHYILHRLAKDSLRCTEADMVNWSKEEVDLEGQADQFSSYLLMPLDDYRKQIPDEVDLDVFIACADRYGVSLTAAILKWLDYTTAKALLVCSTDGFINWACSSERALKAGAFIKTKGRVVPLPPGSLAADGGVQQDRARRNVSAQIWFPHAERGMHLTEMKLVAERLGTVITVLHLPASATVWPPWKKDDEDWRAT